MDKKDSHFAHAINNNNSLIDFNFAAVGDWGCTNNSKNTVSNIIDKDPELVLGLGDNSYSNKAKCWIKIIDPIDHKMKIVIGNHDAYMYANGPHRAPERLQEYVDHFNLSRQFYSFDYQNVHFIAMSTEVPYGRNSDQYDFVEIDLQKTLSEGNMKWIVVFYHRDAYASPSSAGRAIKLLADTYHPLFQKYNVDLVIQAHSHTYQRTYPIEYNTENSSNPVITDYNNTNYYDPNGQIYTVVGTGGAGFNHNFTGPPVQYMAVQFKAFGFLNVNVLHNGSTLVGEFYDNNGTVPDRFSITKSKNKENNLLSSSQNKPALNNGLENKFKIETIYNGLRFPTDMAFLDQNDIIVLEKNNGTVQRIVNGKLFEKPLLDVNVANKSERGLLGIVISKATHSPVLVFLYYTQTEDEGSDVCPKANYCLPGNEPIGNRVYRYELSQDGTKLINPKLLLDLPAVPSPWHNGGKMITGPDKNLFLVVGDRGLKTKAQNYEDGPEPEMTGGILKFDHDGRPLDNGYLGAKYPLDMYFAYGIRNSFGIDFDPRTGNLWDTENGDGFADEINLVKPGFNSGWKDVQGIWQRKGGKPQNPQSATLSLDGLVYFDGKGKYSNPEFIFFKPAGVTAIKFFNSDKMGEAYKNDLFVSDFNNGKIYHFDLNDDRTGLILDGELTDKIADSPNELEKVTFAERFSGITDLEVGPDGYLYVLSFGNGAIYRIVPK